MTSKEKQQPGAWRLLCLMVGLSLYALLFLKTRKLPNF